MIAAYPVGWDCDADTVEAPKITKTCAHRFCGQQFNATNPRQMYCNDNCANNAKSDRWRQRRAKTIPPLSRP